MINFICKDISQLSSVDEESSGRPEHLVETSEAKFPSS